MFKANSNSIKLEILEKFGPKLIKIVFKLKLQLKKWKKLELVMCSNLKFWSSIKLEFDEKWSRSSINIYPTLVFSKDSIVQIHIYENYSKIEMGLTICNRTFNYDYEAVSNYCKFLQYLRNFFSETIVNISCNSENLQVVS